MEVLAPKFFHGPPKIAVSGFNVGRESLFPYFPPKSILFIIENIGNVTLISGTVGAATEAAKLGIPAIAFSGGAGTQIPFFSSLEENPYAVVYAFLSSKVTQTLLDGAEKFKGQPILPNIIFLNVNFSFSNKTICASPDDFQFIFTRINAATPGTGPDFDTCDNTGRLPTEDFVFSLPEGCFTTISVGNATDKLDVDAANQEFVHERLNSILSCLRV